METNNEKLQKFIEAVNDEIDDKINRMLAEAEQEKQAILEAAEKESEEAAERHFNLSSKKNGNEYFKDISKAELNMKKTVIRHREELASKVFKAVEKRLSDFRNDPKYVNLLVKNLLLMHANDGAEIFLSPDDMKYTDILKKAIPSCDVKFTPDEKILLGGLSVYNTEKGTIADKTFDLAVEEQKKVFANSNAFAK